MATTTRKKSSAKKAAPAKRKQASRRDRRATGPAAAPAKRTARAVSARQVAVDVLGKHGGEMRVSELAQAVVASGRVKLNGKTPEATVAAHIYTAAKAGRLFRKTRRGHVVLIPAKP